MSESPESYGRRELFRRAGDVALDVARVGALGTAGYLIVDLFTSSQPVSSLKFEEIIQTSSQTDVPAVTQELGESASRYRDVVEELFGVKIKKSETADWEDLQVLLVGEFISRFPRHFHEPFEGVPLEYVMENDPSACRCSGEFGEDKSRPSQRIYYQSIYFGPDSMSSSHENHAHESGHKVDFSNGNISWPKIEAVMGNFPQAASGVLTRISKDIDLKQKSPDPNDKFLAGKLQYGLRSQDGVVRQTPAELVAVMTHFYTHGRIFFDRISKWIPSDQAKGLYEIIKQDIYRGIEYANISQTMGKFQYDPKTRQPLVVDFLDLK